MEKKRYTVSDQTRQAMANALKELMTQKPLDKITIRDITDLCGMRRQNFYYHFQDIYDLMHWMFQQEVVSLLEKYGGTLQWKEGLLELFHYLQNNRAVCLCTLRSVGRENMKRLFQEDIYAIVRRTVEQISEEFECSIPEITGDDTTLISNIYVIMLTGIAESWLIGDICITPEELVAFMDQMFQDHVQGARLRRESPSNDFATISTASFPSQTSSS